MEQLAFLKLLAAGLLFLAALLGAGCARCLTSGAASLMGLCNAVAGGVLISVAIVHMLGDNVAVVDGAWGATVSEQLRDCGVEDCDPFPLGFVLLVLGLYLLMAVETLLPVSCHSSVRSEVQVPWGAEPLLDCGQGHRPRSGGLGVLLGVSVHSFVESLAMGSTSSSHTFTVLFFAVMLHKSFAAFAVASSLVPIFSGRSWWMANAFFALTAVVGICLGAVLARAADEVACAALQCFVAGTLLSVGLHDMLLPALLGPPKWRLAKFSGSLSAAVAMSLLAEWA